MKLKAIQRIRATVFTTDQAHKVGVSNVVLHYYASRGRLIRVSHGVYRLPETASLDLESMIKDKLIMVPQAIVCMKTALQLFDLIDESPAKIHLMVPSENVPKRALMNVKLFRTKRNLYKRSIIKFRGIPVTTVERTIIDLLRFEQPISLAIDVFKRAQNKKIIVSLSQIKRLATPFRVRDRVDALIEAVI